MGKKRKTRVELRRNRFKPPRRRSWTRDYLTQGGEGDDVVREERVRAKGELSRRRTIVTDTPTESAAADHLPAEMPTVDTTGCLHGRVLKVHGLQCTVETDDGHQFLCVVRRLLRSLVTEERNIVATGDRVWFRPSGTDEGMIETIEPRRGLLTRASRGKEQVIVANVDQLVIVASLAEPALKPHLIDRYLACARQGRIAPAICLNKADLVDPAEFQPLVGMYRQLGVPTLLTSAQTGQGIAELRDILTGRETVFAGQSGVGKTSLLNAIQPGLHLRVAEVSDTTQKGRHTTTTAELIRLDGRGWVVDTPGIRQFSLWNILPDEVEGFFIEMRPYVPYCRFPDCTHEQDSDGCAVLRAVRLHQIPIQRYESYLGLRSGNEPE